MLDIIFLVLLVIGTYSGYKRGFILEVLGIIAIFIGLYGALMLLKFVLGIVIRYIPEYNSYLPLIIFILLFIIIIIIINLAGKIVKKFLDATIFGSFDNLAGAVTGFFLWSFMISLLLWLLRQTSVNIPAEQIGKSYLYPYIVNIAPTIGGYFSSIVPFAESLISGIKDMLAK